MIRGQLKKQSFFFLFAVTLAACNPTQGFAFQLFNLSGFCLTWRPVVSIGGGASIATGMGSSNTFPIVNPITDQFFIYNSNNDRENAGFFDLFAGVEFSYLPEGSYFSEGAYLPEWSYVPDWSFLAELSLQLGLGYNQTGDIDVKGSFTQGADGLSQNQFNFRYQITARQLLAEAKLLYHSLNPCYQLFHPYIFLGLGASSNKAENFSTNVPPFLTFTREFGSHTRTSFSYAVGLGIDFDVTRCIRLGIGYRFTNFGKVELGSATIDTTPVGGTLSSNHFYNNEFLAQATFVL